MNAKRGVDNSLAIALSVIALFIRYSPRRQDAKHATATPIFGPTGRLCVTAVTIHAMRQNVANVRENDGFVSTGQRECALWLFHHAARRRRPPCQRLRSSRLSAGNAPCGLRRFSGRSAQWSHRVAPELPSQACLREEPLLAFEVLQSVQSFAIRCLVKILNDPGAHGSLPCGSAYPHCLRTVRYCSVTDYSTFPTA